MTVSVDDLIASLSSNHIGQDAMDIATLQAQLAQALLSQASTSAQPIQQRRGYAPSNTPLARTPSSSMCWEPTELTRARSSSVASATQLRGIDENKQDMDGMDEDERMVEEMLFSPANATNLSYPPPSSPAAYHGTMARRPSIPHVHSALDSTSVDLPSPNTSHFATTDPFFIAQLQASQAPAPSFFAHAGHPSAHSPFLLQSTFGQHTHHPPAPEVDPAHMFAPPAAFTC